MKKSIGFIVFSLFFSIAFSQNCAVKMPSIKGIYTGDCKKGLAHGKGKATGTDSYEGGFKSGLPQGEGTYTWSNGNRFTGEFVAGLKEGKGCLVIKREHTTDSLVEGVWVKDKYVGQGETSYRLIFKSKKVNELDVEYKKDDFKRISFFITNTSGGANLVDGSEMPRLRVDEIQIQYGMYGRLFINDNHAKKTESILEEVQFPIRFIALIGEEQVEMEFFMPGSYVITLRIND